MKKLDIHEKNISKNCDICGNLIFIDKLGWGICNKCGWQNSEAALENPDYPYLGNFLSFNNAKKLFNEGKPLKANFNEFIEIIRAYGEVQFLYENKVYGVIRGNKISLFCESVENSTSYYNSYEDFKESASIGGLLLKDIWNKVENVDYLQ